MSSFHDELVEYVCSLREDDALKCIANAVPMGLLKTVYTAVINHHDMIQLSLRRGEDSWSARVADEIVRVATRSGMVYNLSSPEPKAHAAPRQEREVEPVAQQPEPTADTVTTSTSTTPPEVDTSTSTDDVSDPVDEPTSEPATRIQVETVPSQWARLLQPGSRGSPWPTHATNVAGLTHLAPSSQRRTRPIQIAPCSTRRYLPSADSFL